ncbi:MAG TPA: hypothetical protein DIU35_00155 [Candidatus Latescibacteria bacterium]|nr:hypothetical protein [Gemmatimonadota bacterium]HCR15869.1 hypothetical protein [Candidatus Latescibacterota bacterium]
MIKTAIIGCGYWGRLLIRSIAQQPDYHIRYFCDIDPNRLAQLKKNYGYVNMTTELHSILTDVAVDAVVIATPVHSHYEIAKACLEAGKHILIEQPMAVRRIHCDELIQLAARKNLAIMVDHIDEYNTSLNSLNRLIQSESLGDLRYMYAQRLNLGESSFGPGVLMELASHEIYFGLNILGLKPFRVSSKGLNLLSPQIEDVSFTTIDFDNGVTFNIHTSWLDPNKVRRLTVVGSDKMAIHDDVSTDAKLTIYNRQADLCSGNSDFAGQESDSFEHFRLAVRTGDVLIPKIDTVEPLRLLCEDFATCIGSGAVPRSDGLKASKVVSLLEAARQSMRMDGTPVELKEWN